MSDGESEVEVDWPAIIDVCSSRPAASLLDDVGALEPAFDNMDLWLWDHQRLTVTSLRTSASRTPSTDGMDDVGDVFPLRWLGDELGLLTVPAARPDRHGDYQRLAELLAVSARSSVHVSDDLTLCQRRDEMSLPAEIQWSLLPPTEFSIDAVSISAAVEPAYDTGGDVFEYALNGDLLFLAVLDARGHGLQAATTSAVAIAALRRARRRGDSLTDIAAEIAAGVASIGDANDFVCAVMVELNLATGRARWLSAGHLPPVLVGDGVVQPLDLEPALPLGMTLGGSMSRPSLREFHFAVDQSLVLYSDGIIENVALEDNRALGAERLHRTLATTVGDRTRDGSGNGAGNLARHVVDELMTVTGTVLRDDATLMIVQRTAMDASG